MDLLPIANKLEALNLGVTGKTLFINFMPMECKQGMMLRSPLSGSKIDHELPGFYKTEFSVIARSHQFVTAENMVKSTMSALKVYDQQVGDIFVKYMRPRTLPVAFPVSEGNFYEVQVVFEIAYVATGNGY